MRTSPRWSILRRSSAMLWTLALVGGLAQAAALGLSEWSLYRMVSTLPSRDDLKGIGQMAQATVIYDASDRPAFSIFEEQRRDVPLDQISPHLTAAIVAVEDQRFFDHSGVDLVRIVGATLANLREGRRAQGGSTLTQQLARQSLLTLDKTFSRKIQEALLAIRLEREYTKEQILELYLNKMYFGAGLYGAEAAALGYFGKPARILTVDEAALIAGLVKSPSTLAPTVNLDRAIARRNVVLQAMRETGAIDEPTFQNAKAAKVHLKDALRQEEPFGQYFKEAIRVSLVERFGREKVYEGGLKVFTTIDLNMQKAAEAAVAASLADLDKRRAAALKARRKTESADAEVLQAALVAIDPRTGEVRAMVGGRNFEESHFNRAIQARRQPGSAFKPFVYAAALEKGFTVSSLITDLDQPIDLPDGAWTPDDDHTKGNEITMRAALTTSSNKAAVRMIEDVGIPNAVTYAKRLGLGDVPAVPSLALGSGEVSLIDLTAAYGAFANTGVLQTPLLLRRVEDGDGNTLFTAEPHGEQAVTPQTAFLMSSMLADVINSGTAWKARQSGFKLPAGGKTGTTNDYHDAWFIGFTPSLVSGVWVGYDQPQPILPGSAYAADVAVPMWAAFMKTATASDKPDWLAPPKDIVTVSICKLSGKRPASGCDSVQVVKDDGSTTERSMIVNEYFVRGTEPQEYCDQHVGRSLFAKMGDWFRDSPKAEHDRPEVAAPEPTAPAAGSADAAHATAEAKADEQPKKKRGFWSRVFGRGDKDDEKKKDE
ncbi:MAG TPA: PBP1A family penicillin-binding protein, partial [Vicinamibacterales bacterium]|nr:PBP1A family penicillin-binding protein [Vicinamibacterales bacterium]